ncbi:hypothetical protein Bca52824_082526 [Brassica carinata]|uniref:Uncharacterized protein n=1 Tax=Brassica carinata TaxID=52824 RepID=A0A8X7TS00_BRACI|nr:hypothetical protein Bca52824_082526 [Brassica carinata]
MNHNDSFRYYESTTTWQLYGEDVDLENLKEYRRTLTSRAKASPYDVDTYDVEYCACAELRRKVSSQDGSTKAGGFEMMTSLGEVGIKYHSLTSTADK